MKHALVNGQLAPAAHNAPAMATCPGYDGSVKLRNRQGTYFWRHVELPRGGCRPPELETALTGDAYRPFVREQGLANIQEELEKLQDTIQEGLEQNRLDRQILLDMVQRLERQGISLVERLDVLERSLTPQELSRWKAALNRLKGPILLLAGATGGALYEALVQDEVYPEFKERLQQLAEHVDLVLGRFIEPELVRIHSAGLPKVIVQHPVGLYFGPTTRSAKERGKELVFLPANSQLTLLSRATYNDTLWLRVRASDEAGHAYVGWVYAAYPPLSRIAWQVGSELKTPPDCAIPLASTHRRMVGVNVEVGELGTWISDGHGDVAVVVDLYRDEVGILSDNLTLHLQLNDRELMTIPIEPQRGSFLLENGVYNMRVSPGDRLVLVLTPSSSNTLRTLQTHVSIFFVPKDCKFGG